MVDGNVGEIDGSRRLPHGFTRGSVQGNDVLDVAPIDVDHDVAIDQSGRTCRAGIGFMITIEVAASPECSTGRGVQASGAIRAEVKEDAARFDDQRVVSSCTES